jgi:TonB family protein
MIIIRIIEMIVMRLPSIRNSLNRAIFLCLLVSCGAILPASAKLLTLGTEYSSEFQKAEPTYSPEPEISPELKEQCFKSCCIAKFLIKKDGSSTVHLLTSSGSDEVDEIALKALRHWKFKPATVNGEPVDSTRKIQVEFEIQ